MPLPEDETEWKKLMVIFATSKGNVRKNTLEDFANINNSGKIAMKLDQDDKIIGVKICSDDQDILLSTQFGKCIRFKSKKLRLFKGRSSKGIKGIQLGEKDKVIIAILQSTFYSIFAIFGYLNGYSYIFFTFLILAIAVGIYNQVLIRNRHSEFCIMAFKNNQYIGLLIFLGIYGEYIL
jgi:DNA gyrase/topoisomerase IV subunit A